MTADLIIAGAGGLVAGAIVGWLLSRKAQATAIARLEHESAKAEQAAREAEIAAREEGIALSAQVEVEATRTRQELVKREDRLRQRHESLDKRSGQLNRQESKLNRRDKELVRREKRVSRQEEDAERTLAEARRKLEVIAGLTQSEARARLIGEVREDARRESLEEIQAIETETRAVAEERARIVVSAAIQRYASDYVGERTVCAVALPSEDMKGRIIGREGRNIRAFEATTGCDLIVDDTPDNVVVSCFSPTRREVGRLALERLLADGRIHPTRIEEVVSKTAEEMDQIVRRRGEAAALELELGGLHAELLVLLGKLHYATSFAQNVLRHSIEVGFLAGVMAAELGLSQKLARRAGLLHDIGKAVDHGHEGPHALVGATVCRKHGESKKLVHAIAAHHEGGREVPMTPLAHIVQAANTLSASRPGARRETVAAQVKRLEDMEAIAQQFDGVEKVFAFRAGQELRVLVDNGRLSDRDAQVLSRDLAQKIERDLTYPGKVKVSVLRETRAVQFAR